MSRTVSIKPPLLSLMENGTTVTFYADKPNGGIFQKTIFLFYADDSKTIYWCEPTRRDRLIPQSIVLQLLVGLFIGKHTPILMKVHNAAPERCISLLGFGVTLNIEFDSESTRRAWLSGIDSIMNKFEKTFINTDQAIIEAIQKQRRTPTSPVNNNTNNNNNNTDSSSSPPSAASSPSSTTNTDSTPVVLHSDSYLGINGDRKSICFLVTERSNPKLVPGKTITLTDMLTLYRIWEEEATLAPATLSAAKQSSSSSSSSSSSINSSSASYVPPPPIPDAVHQVDTAAVEKIIKSLTQGLDFTYLPIAKPGNDYDETIMQILLFYATEKQAPKQKSGILGQISWCDSMTWTRDNEWYVPLHSTTEIHLGKISKNLNDPIYAQVEADRVMTIVNPTIASGGSGASADILAESPTILHNFLFDLCKIAIVTQYFMINLADGAIIHPETPTSTFTNGTKLGFVSRSDYETRGTRKLMTSQSAKSLAAAALANHHSSTIGTPIHDTTTKPITTTATKVGNTIVLSRKPTAIVSPTSSTNSS